MNNLIFKNKPSNYIIPLKINGCKPNGLQFRTMQYFLPSGASLRLAVIFIPLGMNRLVENIRFLNIFIPLGMNRSVKN